MENHRKESTIELILDLLSAAGYVHATNSDAPPSQIIAAGLSWCIAALDASVPTTTIDGEDALCIEEGLRSVGCPYPLRSSDLRDLDAEVIFPVIQWLSQRLLSTQEASRNEVCHSEHADKGDEQSIKEDREFEKTEISIKALTEKLDELNHRKMTVVEQLDHLRARINKNGADSVVQNLICLMVSLKDLDGKENHFQSHRDSKHLELLDEINELEKKIANDCDSKSLSDELQHAFSELNEKLHLKKMQLAARLRDIVSIRRQIDDLPCQWEIKQYECRLSELYAQIQGKHRQTRKYYATYNALLEIKEMMLKETSLLNSIISQFQEAFSSAEGRTKLVHSMEGIVKGSQQKLEKVQSGLQEEERIRNDVNSRYAASIGEQKRCYSLLKAFQVECAKNE